MPGVAVDGARSLRWSGVRPSDWQYFRNEARDTLSFCGTDGRRSPSAASSCAHWTITSHASILSARARAAAIAPRSMSDRWSAAAMAASSPARTRPRRSVAAAGIVSASARRASRSAFVPLVDRPRTAARSCNSALSATVTTPYSSHPRREAQNRLNPSRGSLSPGRSDRKNPSTASRPPWSAPCPHDHGETADDATPQAQPSA